MDNIQTTTTTVPVNEGSVLTKPYFAGIDILKFLASFLVVTVHFFLYSGFYSTPLNEEKFMFPIALRWIAYCCVPIFMTATGYLMKNKTLSKKYYTGLIKIGVIYVAISIACMIFDYYHYYKDFTVWKVLKGFLEYSNAQYGWYINYYFAMFAIIPFLNLAFNGLKTKNQRLVLVITSAALTLFARSLFLGFARDEQIKVFPDYLASVFPIAYYYAGAFIREYPPKKCAKNKLIFGGIYIAALLFLTISTYTQSKHDYMNSQKFLSYHFNDYGTYPVYIMTVALFLLLFDITTKSNKAKFVLKQLSGTTLPLYLVSYIFDSYFYLEFNNKHPDMFDRATHCYEIIFKVFLCSFAVALVTNNLYNMVAKLITKKKQPKPIQTEEQPAEQLSDDTEKSEAGTEEKSETEAVSATE